MQISLNDFRDDPASIVAENVVAGFSLGRANEFIVQQRTTIKEGDTVLIDNQGQAIIASWSHELVADPYVVKYGEDVGEEVIDGDDETDPQNKLLIESMYSASNLCDCLFFDPEAGYRFYQACLDAGYSVERHGIGLSSWLNDRFAIAIKNAG